MKLRFTMENYGTMEKKMVLYREIWNYDLRIKKKHGRYQKVRNLASKRRNYNNIPNIPNKLKFLNKCIA